MSKKSKIVKVEKTENQELAVYTDVDGLEELLPEDLTIPRLKLDHDKGVLVDDSTNEEFEELEVVLLGIKKSRSMFPEYKPGIKASPICQSIDFYHSVAGENCLSCKRGQWGYDEDDQKPIPPKCLEIWTFPLFINADPNRPALLSAKRTSLTPARKYVTPFAKQGLPPFSSITILSTEAVDNYFVVKFERGLPTEEDIQNIARKEWQLFRKRFIQVDQPENAPANVVEVVEEDEAI